VLLPTWQPKGKQIMRSFGIERKLFLIASLVFVLEFGLGTVVALQFNLSGADLWLTDGTALTAPGVFMVPYMLFLLLAFRRRWVGTVGVVGVTLQTLISGLSWIPDHGLVQQVLAQHLNFWTGLTVALLVLATPTTVVLGILTLVQQRKAHRSAPRSSEALPEPIQ